MRLSCTGLVYCWFWLDVGVHFLTQSYFYYPLLIVCCLGHAMIWVRAINWTHGIRSQTGWVDLIRHGLHFILSGLPFLWLYFTRFQLPQPLWEYWPGWLQGIFAGYLVVVGLMGFFWFPLLWRNYVTRKEPAVQVSLQSDCRNIEQELGKRPVGEGRRGWMAHLPWNQAYQIELVERELVIPRLPYAWDGIRLLHLSDTHFWGRPSSDYFKRLFHHIAQRQTDILILTGDLVDSDNHYDSLNLLKTIPYRDCALAIRGNHDARYDYKRVNQVVEGLGIMTLGGTSKIIMLRGNPMLVAGNEAPWLPPVPDLTAHSGFEGFRLALIHSPDQFSWAVREKFDLVLAGHNHGGQIRLPGFGSIFVPSKTGRRYDMGLHEEQATLLHVSRGVSGGHPIRYFCRPEVTWLTLRCQSQTT